MKYLTGTLLFMIMLLLAGCQEGAVVDEDASTNGNEEEKEAVYRVITPEEAKEMMAQEGIIILDVREQSEFDQGYIEGATLLPLGTISAGDLSLIPDKDQTILVYCRSGNRSGQAAKILVANGYTQVYDFGGVLDWPYGLVQ